MQKMAKKEEEGEDEQEEKKASVDLDTVSAWRLLPFSKIFNLIRNAIVIAKISGHEGVIMDGFPTSIEECILFGAKIGEPTVCLDLEVKDSVVLERLMESRGMAEDAVMKLMTAYSTDKSVGDRLDSLGLVKKLNGNQSEDAVFVSAVDALERRQIHIPTEIAA